MELEREIATYDRSKDFLKPYKDKWVLIKGDEIIDFFDTFADGIEAGYDRFGLDGFLVNLVGEEDNPHFVRTIYAPSIIRQRAA